MPAIILSFLVPFALAIQAFNSGYEAPWPLLLLLIPMIWAVAYATVDGIPTSIGAHVIKVARNKIVAIVGPRNALREAEDEYASTGSVTSAVALAGQYLMLERHLEAKTLFQCSAFGPYGENPELLMGLAKAHFGLQEYQHAVDCLDVLKQKHPESTTADGHLLYAKCLQELGRTGEAIHEFKSLAGYHPSPEAACRLGLLYKRIGDLRKAYNIFENVLAHSKQMNEPYLVAHAEWLTIARNEVRKWAPLQ
jgi:hypothetical protein